MRRNINSSKICAFCKHWFDPACTAIQPVAPRSGLWEVDANIKKQCLKRNGIEKKADFRCGDFERKSI
ncbi:MAG: hypothetical protein LUG66_05660 [Clostridiales bacterium]|nr:hypothetical protein [Clostridiales bacterium]